MDAAAALAEQLAGLTRPEDRAARDALLGAALQDPAPAVREAATAWAARLLEPARLAELVADEANARLRNTALEALRRQGPYAVDHLCSMLDAGDPDIVMFAIQVLALIGAPSSIPSLLPLIHHSAPNVAQSAVDALGRLKAREAVPALLALVRSDDLWLQLAAVQALGAIGDPAGAAGLLELVPGSPLAESALEALEELGAPENLTPLLALLESNDTQALRERVVRAAAASLRRADSVPDSAAAFGARVEQERGPGGTYRYLAEALASAPPAEDAPAVGDDRRSASNSPLFRAAAELVLGCGIGSLLPALAERGASPERPDWLRGLAGRRSGALRPALAGLVTNPDGGVREGALRIATFRPEDGGMLLPLLHDPVPAVREAACRAIGRVGESSAIPWLLERLRAGTPGERRAATEALGQMPGAALVGMAPYLAPGAERELVLAALDVLARSGSDVFENRTLELARSPEPDLRRAALRALAAIPGTRTEVVLFRALADRAREVQAEALELLVRRGGARVIQALLALLGANDSLRYHVIRALGRLRATDAAAQLERLYPSCPPHEQLEIISALSSIRPPELRNFLRDRLAEEDVEFRRAAARGLAGAVTEGDLDLLITLAADRDWFVRNEAARGLGALKLPACRPALLDLVRDVEAVVAATARSSLDALAATPGWVIGVDDAEWRMLAELIESRFGLAFRGVRREILESRLNPRLTALNLQSFFEYYRYLRYHPERDLELDELVRRTTNNETYFFREPHHFEIIAQHIVPELGAVLRERPLRVLSAGCSSGEEPYSLVITLQNAGIELGGVRWEIDAIDLNAARLEQARRAEYEQTSLRACDEETRARYFTMREGRYILRERYRKGTRFFAANLAAPFVAPEWNLYDAILCRNLLIYFSDSAFSHAIEFFARLLPPGGYLMLGHSESLLDRSPAFAPVVVNGIVVYRRTGTD